jgi:hypothetical protein
MRASLRFWEADLVKASGSKQREAAPQSGGFEFGRRQSPPNKESSQQSNDVLGELFG